MPRFKHGIVLFQSVFLHYDLLCGPFLQLLSLVEHSQDEQGLYNCTIEVVKVHCHSSAKFEGSGGTKGPFILHSRLRKRALALLRMNECSSVISSFSLYCIEVAACIVFLVSSFVDQSAPQSRWSMISIVSHGQISAARHRQASASGSSCRHETGLSCVAPVH